ncbi:MAG: hypothetical protein CVV27_11710, partial [Candidatus Melainabacteria bacterium HGW-Melainabacteria-1]
MSNFSTRLGSSPSPLQGSPQSQSIKKTDKPLPPTPLKPKQLPPTPPPKPIRGQESQLAPETVTQISQGIETTPSSTIRQNSSQVPRVSGLPQQSEPKMQPSETLIKHVSHENQARSIDGQIVVGEKLAQARQTNPPSRDDIAKAPLQT